VKDNGIGMNPETLKKLFTITEKVSVTGTAGESGTGLGLILCKEFVEKNNGKIRAESEPGKGSRFVFTLPATA
jgi:signal transduction histidine kinase